MPGTAERDDREPAAAPAGQQGARTPPGAAQEPAGRPAGRRSPHETRALLRAHLSAAAGHHHLTRHCAVCHRLLRLAMEPREAC